MFVHVGLRNEMALAYCMQMVSPAGCCSDLGRRPESTNYLWKLGYFWFLHLICKSDYIFNSTPPEY